MLAAIFEKNSVWPTVRQIPVPQPGPGEVLVRMAAAPINPSDLGFLKYDVPKQFPFVTGIEGSGTVVASGPGFFPRLFLGKRVICSASTSGGTWAEYMVTRAASCIPLRKNLSMEQGATMLVNPLTALAFIDIARKDKHTAIANTAAASALGQMILRLGMKYHIPVINIVRKNEQEKVLDSRGAKFIIRSDEQNFADNFRNLAHELKATLLLDAVGGELARQMLEAAPYGSTLLAYANLSGEKIVIDPHLLWHEEKNIGGFFLGNWVKKKNIMQMIMDVRRAQSMASNELQTTIQKRFPLSAAREALELYRVNPTAGKVLLVADTQAMPLV